MTGRIGGPILPGIPLYERVRRDYHSNAFRQPLAVDSVETVEKSRGEAAGPLLDLTRSEHGPLDISSGDTVSI